MSNRIFKLFLALAVVVVGLSSFLVLTHYPSRLPIRENSSFPSVNDRPLVESLDKYYELVRTGRTMITVDGEKHWVYWGDFSPDEKQKLQLELRTP